MTQDYRYLIERTKDISVDYLNGASERNVFPCAEDLSVLQAFDEPLPSEGVEASSVIELLNRLGSPATTAQIGGRYFGFVNGGLLPVAHAAEWIVDTWNANSALYAMSPAAAVMESVCEKWIAELFDLPEDTALGLATGSSNALICALAAARNELLNRIGYQSSKGIMICILSMVIKKQNI